MAAASPPPRPAGGPVPGTSVPSNPPPSLVTVADHGIVRHDSLRAERWTADGSVKVSGDVEVGSADVAGTVSVGGRLSARALRSRGTLEVEGPVEVRELLSTRGNAHLGSTVHAGQLALDGDARIGGAVTVDREGTVRGNVHAPSLTAGLLELDGSATIPGEVRALEVLARFRLRSELGEVRARRVRLFGRVSTLVDKVFFRFEPVTVERVEADSVELEAVEVAFVRAKEIVLGRDAHVTTLEGTVVRRHPSSSVGPESKSPPPYGLRR